MSRRVVFRVAAAKDFEGERTWYESKRPGLGKQFADCIDAAIRKASRAPARYPKVHGDIRRVLVKRFPFGVFYLVEGSTFVVVAVFNCAR